MTERKIESRLRRLEELQKQIEALTEEADSIKMELKTDMEEKGLDEMRTQNHVIRWKMIQGSRLDGKALKEAHPRIYARFLVPTTSHRFTVV